MIYFHNPHYASFYGTNVFNALTRRFNHRKYWYIGRYILSQAEKDVGILINLEQNSFAMFFTYKVPFLNRIVTLCELAVWLVLNRVNPFKVPVRFSTGCLTSGDVVVVFAFDNLQRPVSLLEELSKTPCVKVVHMTHYLFDTSRVSAHAEKLGAVFFAAESNLTKYPYFAHYFPYYCRDTYLLPFIPQPRFSRRKSFSERNMKCLALGTLTILRKKEETKDVMDFFGTDCVHPMRRAIYENRDSMRDMIASSVSLYNADAPSKDVKAQQNVLAKAYSALWNLINAKQKKYFSFSAADQFNKYAMFVVPEEINNLPAMGWVEGMACGSAYIGLDDPMYTDLGLRPGEHYISYDNTLQGLLDVIKHYQKNPAELERIAENGYRFVTELLNGPRAAAVFLADLRELAAQAAAGTPPESLKFSSSFVKAEK